ncbi:hypothetical protein BFP72_11490 [Reichenbachiella sp. 5M10]|uniref:T9SS type A sorting domain-containing protein n=1 Tax=Reichenbachiella sp. 5M10 TaxID=1889772 RepID=UPI000C15C768|nr:T9SS type A sorting domain-containing protein [Reichenbachiella sp. 5M10]PIB35974.1 hypothetical protein BFP72_11490 [Reichenbachiella sp. 5M10]
MKSVYTIVFVIAFYLLGVSASAQRISVADGNWATGVTWGGTAPGYSIGENVTIDSYVISDETVTLTGNNKTLSVIDTLIIRGSLIFTANSGAAINIGPNNVLIIMENLDLGKNNAGANIEAGGVLVVKGDITASGTNGEFTGDGKVYTDGTTDGVTNNGSQPEGDIDDLSDDSFGTIEDFVRNGGEGSLPVELLYFRAVWDQSSGSAVLSWATATEMFNDYFSVERSEDGVNYEEIASVAGHGNSNAKIEYAYSDQTVQSTTNYYRLKQVDFDGGFEYFDQIRLSIPSYFETAINLYPSIVRDGSMTLEANQEVLIQDAHIFSLNGEKSQNFQLNPIGYSSYRLDIQGMTQGVYFLSITTDQGEVMTKRFVITQ